MYVILIRSKAVCKSSFKLDVIKIKQTRTQNTRERIPTMYSTVSKYEMSFDIVTQIFAVDLGFVRCTAGSLKRSSCVGERMRAT